MPPVRRTIPTTILIVALAGPLAATDPPSPEPGRKQRTDFLDALLADYKLYELPFPPPDAPLVRHFLYHQTPAMGESRAVSGLGFWIKPRAVGEPDRVFAGFATREPWVGAGPPTTVEVTPEVLRGLAEISVELAVQLHARGRSDLARLVLDREADPAGPLPETVLARSAWRYWLDEFRRNGADRAKVARLLNTTLARRTDGVSRYDERIVKGLELSLVPGRGKPGTVEALIDALVVAPGTTEWGFWAADGPGVDTDTTFTKLARHGFDAVPALLAHLEDPRLTRTSGWWVHDASRFPYLLGDVVGTLLVELAGGELKEDFESRFRELDARLVVGPTRPPSDFLLDKAAATAWWAEAKKVGEETYLIRHVLRPRQDVDEGRRVNRLILDVMAHKYPNQLPELYRRILRDRPEDYVPAIGAAVLGSALSAETKRALFLEGAGRPDIEVRTDAVHRLCQFDRPRGLKLLMAELVRAADDPPGEMVPLSPDRLAGMVQETNEPAAWAALATTAKRTRVEWRRGYLDNLLWPHLPAVTRKATLAYLSQFLDDASVDRNDQNATSRNLEIRNRVAEHLAGFLNVRIVWKPGWTAEEWAGLRAEARKALAKEGIR
ncbi:MAG TPA: hypothetical protein VM597_37945 [Gemmataceae bacterium]|nr:hypothetical protein [Gemmataceae bacterium]